MYCLVGCSPSPLSPFSLSSFFPVAEITAQAEFDIPENIGTFSVNLVLLGQKAAGRQCIVTATTMDDTALSTGKKHHIHSN